MDLKDCLPAYAEENANAGVMMPDEEEATCDPYGGFAEPPTPSPKVRGLYLVPLHDSSCFLSVQVKKTTKRLDMVKWLSAYECFALAAHAAEVGVGLFHHSF